MIHPVIAALIAALIAVTVLTVPHSATGQAQEPGIGDCGPRQAVAQYVMQLMGDPRNVMRAVAVENGMLVEEISNDRRWIMLATRQDGVTCILGVGWRV